MLHINRYMSYKFNTSIALKNVLKSYFVNKICRIAKQYISSNDIIKAELWDKEILNNVEEFLSINEYNLGVFHFISLNEINI